MTIQYIENEAIEGLLLISETDQILIESHEWTELLEYVETLRFKDARQLSLPFDESEEK